MTHTLLLSIAARRHLLLLRLVCTEGNCSCPVPSDTTVLYAIAVRIRGCSVGRPPKYTHGASCIGPDDSFCTELQWLTRVSSALQCLAPFLRTVFSYVVPIVKVASLVATHAMIDDGKTPRLARQTENIPLLGTPKAQ